MCVVRREGCEATVRGAMWRACAWCKVQVAVSPSPRLIALVGCRALLRVGVGCLLQCEGEEQGATLRVLCCRSVSHSVQCHGVVSSVQRTTEQVTQHTQFIHHHVRIAHAQHNATCHGVVSSVQRTTAQVTNTRSSSTITCALHMHNTIQRAMGLCRACSAPPHNTVHHQHMHIAHCTSQSNAAASTQMISRHAKLTSHSIVECVRAQIPTVQRAHDGNTMTRRHTCSDRVADRGHTSKNWQGENVRVLRSEHLVRLPLTPHGITKRLIMHTRKIAHGMVVCTAQAQL
jgi:hypothetical protein